MTLKLTLDLPRPRVPLGGEIRLRSTLSNEGATAVEVASLFENNVITNYVLSDDEGHVLAELNHVTRQQVMEKVEPRTTDLKMITLAPGQSESRDDNLCRYIALERPGLYRVQGLYRWNGTEVRSEWQRLEIVAAPLRSYDQQWAHHYGEKFLLHSCWVAEAGDEGEMFLRESLRFRPQAINHNPSLGGAPKGVAPRLSFNRSLMAGGSVWVAWLSDGGVTAFRTERGRAVTSAASHTVPLHDLDWVAPPLTTEAGDVLLLVSGLEPGAGRRVLALHLDPSGQETTRALLTPPLRGMVLLQGVCDENGGFHLFWATGDTFELWHLPIDLDALQASGPAQRLWRLPSSPLGIFAPGVLTADTFLCCMLLLPDPSGLRIGSAWLQLDDPAANPVKLMELTLPGPDTVRRVVGELDDAGRLFALVTTDTSVFHVDGRTMETRRLCAADELEPTVGAWLTVNHRADVFFGSSRRLRGLCEELVDAHDDEGFDDNEVLE